MKNGTVFFRWIVEKYIPFKTVTIRPKDKPWMSGQVRLAILELNRFLKLHNRNPKLTAWDVIVLNEIEQPH